MSVIIRRPLGYFQASVTTAVSLASAIGTAIPTGAERVLIIPETNAIRWRDDAGTPTASVGMPCAASGVLNHDGNLSNLFLVSQSGTALVNFSFYANAGGFNA